MKKICFLFVLLLFLVSCLMPPEIYMNNHEYEYNPKRAGAEIVDRIEIPGGLYLRYSNHYYLLSENKITIFDLSADNVIIHNEITYNIHDIFPNEDSIEYSISDYNGIFTIGNIIYFKLGIAKIQHISSSSIKYLDFYYPIFSVNLNGTELSLSDLTSDLFNPELIENIVIDNETESLYTAVNNTNSCDIYCYQYNKQTNHFENKKKTFTIDGHQIGSIYMTNQYCLVTYYECVIPKSWYTNMLYIHSGFNSSFQEVDFTYLHLYNRPRSAFSDSDGNIWLYVNEDDKYELLKLKLVEKEEPTCIEECWCR